MPAVYPFICVSCGATVGELPSFASFRRVTSDCQPWPAGGRLGHCAACGLVQKAVDMAWREEIARIYAQYAIYYQADGAEQAVFDGGVASARSERILGGLTQAHHLPEQGRLLDVGCGNGGFLRAFARRTPQWELFGTEWDDKHASALNSIPGFRGLHTGDLAELSGLFDLISMIHVLEHMEAPRRELAKLHAKLAPDGRLVIQLPNYPLNPFDLLIADHALHVTSASLKTILRATGFDVMATEAWVGKELSVVARPTVAGAAEACISEPVHDAPQVQSALDWLAFLRALACQARAEGPMGIFGTSIAGTWLATELPALPDFFVDEDPNRIGRLHMDRPIMAPDQVPTDASVVLALPSQVAQVVGDRLSAFRNDLRFVFPQGR